METSRSSSRSSACCRSCSTCSASFAHASSLLDGVAPSIAVDELRARRLGCARWRSPRPRPSRSSASSSFRASGRTSKRAGVLDPQHGLERRYLGDTERQLEPAEHGPVQAVDRRPLRACRACAGSASTAAASWTGVSAGCGCSRQHATRTSPSAEPAAERCRGSPRRACKRVAGRCSPRRSPPNTTCASASRFTLPSPRPPTMRLGRLDDEPRMATGRDRAQLRRLCARLGEAATRAHTRSRPTPGAPVVHRARSGSQRLDAPSPVWPWKAQRTRAAPLRRHGSGLGSADADPAARADRRGARARRRDGRDDLAAARAHRVR